jgi:hypothetical protein
MRVERREGYTRAHRILYVGPEGAGKTSTLLAVHRLSREPVRGPLRYLSSRLAPKSTIDLLTLELGLVEGARTRALLYTVPGNKEGLKLLSRIVRSATCIVFVSDSQIARVGSNLDFIYEFRTNIMGSAGFGSSAPPVIYQFNKMDLPATVEPCRLAEILGISEEPYFSTAAITGTGVFVPLKTAIERSIWFRARLESARVGASA